MRNLFAASFLLFGISFLIEAYVLTRDSRPTITSLASSLTESELAIFEDPIVERAPDAKGVVTEVIRNETASSPAAVAVASATPRINKKTAPVSSTAKQKIESQTAAIKLGSAERASDKTKPEQPQARDAAPGAAHLAAREPSSFAFALASADAADTRDDSRCRSKMKKLGVVYPDKCTDLSAIVKDLAVGVYSFNKPIKAYVDEPFHVTLVLKTALKQDVSNYFINLAGDVTSREGKFSQSVAAVLKADDLFVSPSESQPKNATSEEPVAWDWTITPKSPGEKTLIIEVVANIQVGKDKHPVSVRTLREAITIEVSYVQRVMVYVAATNGYVLAASATATAVAGMIGLIPPIRKFFVRYFRRRARKRVRNGTAAASEAQSG